MTSASAGQHPHEVTIYFPRKWKSHKCLDWLERWHNSLRGFGAFIVRTHPPFRYWVYLEPIVWSQAP